MTDNPVKTKPVNSGKRYIIKAKTPEYYEAIKRLYYFGITRAQVHKILDITKGNIVGLRVAKHVGVPKIWFTYKGIRYDVKPNGTLAGEVKIGQDRNMSQQKSKKVKCGLCGKEVSVAIYDVNARCTVCGSRLSGYSVVMRK